MSRSYWYCPSGQKQCIKDNLRHFDLVRRELGSLKPESFNIADYLEVTRYPETPQEGKEAQRLRFYYDEKKCNDYCSTRGTTTTARKVLPVPALSSMIAGFLPVTTTTRAPSITLQKRIVPPLAGALPTVRPETHVYDVRKCPEIILQSEAKDAKGNYLYETRDIVRCIDTWLSTPFVVERAFSSWLYDNRSISPIIKGRNFGPIWYEVDYDSYSWVFLRGDIKSLDEFKRELPSQLWQLLVASGIQEYGSQITGEGILDVVLDAYRSGLIDNFLLSAKDRTAPPQIVFGKRWLQRLAQQKRKRESPGSASSLMGKQIEIE